MDVMKLSVAIAFGGVSVEHEISILSAMQAIAAFPDAYEIVPLYIAKDGRMYSDASFQKTEVFQDLTKVTQENYEVQLVREHQRVLMQWKKHHFWKTSRVIDFVLPILHGTNGEDGSFQGFLKTLHVPFAQCGVLSGALGQDKVAMKMILQDQGLPLVPWFYWWKQEPLAEAFFAKAQRLGYPMIIKPSNLGSSIGSAVVQNAQELKKAMEEGFQYDDKIVIEKVITPLREINASVLGDMEDAKCSVLEEVVKQDTILSFQDKYEGHAKSKGMAGTNRRVPASLEKEEAQEITSYALASFQALQAEGVVRIDFLMNADTKDIYVNEINSIPGSLAYYLWEASGLTFTKLLEELIQLGMKRWRREEKRIVSFDTNVLQLQAKGGSKQL